MYYKDQLVLTGEINDVGAYTRTNIPKSYRAGVEIVAAAEIAPWLTAAGNVSVSRNKVIDFTEYIDDYDNGDQQSKQYSSTDIAFSPNMIVGATISFIPLKNAELSFISKYVGKQYLDNTQNDNRKLNAYYTQDARLIYTINEGCLKELNIILQANNLFNKLYEPNGYTFSYYYGGSLTTENYYFPMAGTNFMVGVNVRF
jgi:iron complex outermembrane receptor protein